MKRVAESGYRADLAAIHDDGFGGVAREAAALLRSNLRRRGMRRGTIVDLGCGSGILAREMTDAGYDVLGIDLSSAMLALARRRAPVARFRRASLLDAEIPACVAVTAIGECVNYLFDAGNSANARRALFRRVHKALIPGGLFLFDVAGPGRVTGHEPTRVHTQGDGWAVLMIADEDPRRGLLTRRITTFRRTGKLYRRTEEVHCLRLVPRAAIERQLGDVGFRTRALETYGRTPFLPGVTGYLAEKLRERTAAR
jgi:SAM-dependent methyltransferase